ncbi:MAG: ATP-binding cassette domain-containing protein [Ruminococcaceae bacterium]|nr:ATP-binding cassette domain-containing protein [Oscillospiraceae bacterium]
MLFLESFRLASADQEDGFVLSYPYQLEMRCFSHENVYPFKIFPQKGLRELCFAPITVLYGGNGSGKSTLLNVIAEKLSITQTVPFNNTPFMEDYLRFCSYTLENERRAIPKSSLKLSSDGVFDYLLDVRAINEGVGRNRDELFFEYERLREDPMKQLESLEDFERFREQFDAKRKTKSAFVSKRMKAGELNGKSNGESAFLYFTQKITENALFLLDEPENSLSAELQIELAKFLEDSARFYNCQLIIATHSPFLLAMRGARVYDLDSVPVAEKPWTELKNIRIYHRFFSEHEKDFH